MLNTDFIIIQSMYAYLRNPVYIPQVAQVVLNVYEDNKVVFF